MPYTTCPCKCLGVHHAIYYQQKVSTLELIYLGVHNAIYYLHVAGDILSLWLRPLAQGCISQVMLRFSSHLPAFPTGLKAIQIKDSGTRWTTSKRNWMASKQKTSIRRRNHPIKARFLKAVRHEDECPHAWRTYKMP